MGIEDQTKPSFATISRELAGEGSENPVLPSTRPICSLGFALAGRRSTSTRTRRIQYALSCLMVSMPSQPMASVFAYLSRSNSIGKARPAIDGHIPDPALLESAGEGCIRRISGGRVIVIINKLVRWMLVVLEQPRFPTDQRKQTARSSSWWCH